MSRFSDDKGRPASMWEWRKQKRKEAEARNAATPATRRRAHREAIDNGRILRDGRWTTP